MLLDTAGNENIHNHNSRIPKMNPVTDCKNLLKKLTQFEFLQYKKLDYADKMENFIIDKYYKRCTKIC